MLLLNLNRWFSSTRAGRIWCRRSFNSLNWGNVGSHWKHLRKRTTTIPTPSNSPKKLKLKRPPRREVQWRFCMDMERNRNLDSIARRFGDYLDCFLSSSSDPPLRRIKASKETYSRLQTLHQCPGYLREEISLTTDVARSAIISHEFPSPSELCSVCGQIVQHQEPQSEFLLAPSASALEQVESKADGAQDDLKVVDLSDMEKFLGAIAIEAVQAIFGPSPAVRPVSSDLFNELSLSDKTAEESGPSVRLKAPQDSIASFDIKVDAVEHSELRPQPELQPQRTVPQVVLIDYEIMQIPYRDFVRLQNRLGLDDKHLGNMSIDDKVCKFCHFHFSYLWETLWDGCNDSLFVTQSITFFPSNYLGTDIADTRLFLDFPSCALRPAYSMHFKVIIPWRVQLRWSIIHLQLPWYMCVCSKHFLIIFFLFPPQPSPVYGSPPSGEHFYPYQGPILPPFASLQTMGPPVSQHSNVSSAYYPFSDPNPPKVPLKYQPSGLKRRAPRVKWLFFFWCFADINSVLGNWL